MILSDEMIGTLQQLGDIPKDIVTDMLRRTEHNALKFCQEIIRHGYLSKEQAGSILGDSVNIAYINLDSTLFQDEVLAMLPREMAERYQAIPIYQMGSSVTVALSRPDDLQKVRIIENLIGIPIDPLLSFPYEIDDAIEVRYHTKSEVDDILEQVDIDKFALLTDEQIAVQKPIVQISEALLMLGIKERVSDIHIEPKAEDYAVRFRIDGALREKLRLPLKIGGPLVSRYKVMSSLNIAERRQPQDGKIAMKISDGEFDVRVSILPSSHGEKLVMRLLGSIVSGVPLDINRISMSEHVLRPFTESLEQPNGIIFVTGPTGSGKSTTLYSGINHINRPEINIMTIEDPIEYQIATITQTQIDNKAGRSFASILRASLRQDPDVILVGEIRDYETARIASEAALTGHLVLTTLHTNGALQAITRLIDMGVEPYVIAPAIIGVLAQRLVRRNCEYCKYSYVPDEETLRKYFFWEEAAELPEFYRGRGCDHCSGTGYSGRIGIYEFVRVDAELRDLILRKTGFTELRDQAGAKGFRDMRYDGFSKALQGITTLDEVVRVTSSD